MRPNPIRPSTILVRGPGCSGHSWRSMAWTPLWILLLVGAFLIPATISDGAGNAERGEQVYRANCFSCHGVDPAHDGPLGPAIQGSSEALLKIRLEKGGRHYPPGYKAKRETAVMPPMAHLVSQVEHLRAYLNKGHVEPPAARQGSSLKGQALEGRALFAMTCAGCHQKDGGGKVGLAPSVTNQDFLGRCIRCNQCGEACPNTAIKFMGLSRGLANWGTPYIVPREQACILCMKCGEVCPTGAIRQVQDEFKAILSNVRMGKAVLDKSQCLSYQGKTCGVCYRACPLAGVAMTIGFLEQPTVTENCVGCGLCERVCIQTPQAIRIYPSGKGAA